MNILIDSSNARTGGAIQNGLSFIKKAAQTNDSLHMIIVASPEISSQINRTEKLKFSEFITSRKINNLLDIFLNVLDLKKVEKKNKPELVFTISGPAYWKSNKIHIMGFAKPHYIYPDLNIFFRLNIFSNKINSLKLYLKKKIHAYFFRRANYLVCQTSTVKKRSSVALNFNKNNIFIVRNGYSKVFLDSFNYLKSKKNKTKKNYKKKYSIFIPTSYYIHKNLEIIPGIIKILEERNIKFEFVITLSLSHVKKSVSFRKFIELSIKKQCRFIGKVNLKDLPKYYLSCDLVFLPTLLECSSAVYPESMISGKPVLTSDLDFARENCEKAAVYFNPFDEVNAADKIQDLLLNDKNNLKRTKLGYKILRKNYLSPKEKYKLQLSIINKLIRENKELL